MTAAAAVFCCTVAVALWQGYGSGAFRAVVASDAINATLPFLGVLVVARFLARRFADRPVLVRRVERLHVVVQAALACMAFGWWWVEPHAVLTNWTSGSLAAMGWQALLGVAAGLALALLSERTGHPVLAREIGLGSAVTFLIAGGRIYRGFDHVEAGLRLNAALAITAVFLATAVLAYLLLRSRPRTATAIPALAPALACAALVIGWNGQGPAEPSAGDSVLLVVIDTLRADVADQGMHGDQGAMPELAKLAAKGVRFTQAVSPAPWTLPATVSLMSGWNPHRHRYGESASDWQVTTGDPDALYLARTLRESGYLTSAFVHNPYLRPYFGFGRDFYTMRPYHGRAVDGAALALNWLSDHMGSASLTLLHLMDPHWPYEAPAGYGQPRRVCEVCDSLFWSQYGAPTDEDRAELRRRYTAEVRFTDSTLGRLLGALAQSDGFDRTWLIVTSDHGEEFWEHGGFLHGHSLFDELLRVPLVIVPPPGREGFRRGVRLDDQVRLEDVAATVLEIVGLDPGLAVDGRSLLPAMRGQDAAASPVSPVSPVSVGGLIKSPDNLSYSVRRPPWKAVVAPTMFGTQLYNLEDDPSEKQGLLFRPESPDLPQATRQQWSRTWSSLVAQAKDLDLELARRPVPASEAAPDADTARNLRSLGYAE